MNYNLTVNKCLSQINYEDPIACNEQLRTYTALAPSFLILDSSHPESTGDGIDEWATGLNSIFDILVALHDASQLEYATVQAASRALGECWANSDTIPCSEAAQRHIKELGARLRELMDEPDSTSSTAHYNGREVDMDFT